MSDDRYPSLKSTLYSITHMVLNLFACTPEGDQHAVEVDENGSVADLKKSAGRVLGVPPQSVEVVFEEEILCDSMNLNDTTLDEESCIQVLNKKYEAIKRLETEGIVVSPRSLLKSAKDGRLDLLKLHLAAGIDSESQSSFGGTPLLTAAAEGRADVVEYLVKEFPSQVTCANCLGETPLIVSVHSCFPTVVKILLDAGVDPNTADRYGCTALLACAISHVDATRRTLRRQKLILDYLLSAGSDPNITNSSGETPLDILQRCDNSYGVTAIETILKNKKRAAISELELSNIAVSPRSMMQCAQSGHLKQLRLHIDAGLSTEMTSSFGHSLLYVACSSGKVGVSRFLVKKYKSLVDAPNGDLQETPLLESCRKGFIKIVRILLDAGANPNRADIYGCTPLMSSINGHHTGVVKCLLEVGAHVSVKDNDGCTALHLAESVDYIDIINLLRKY